MKTLMTIAAMALAFSLGQAPLLAQPEPPSREEMEQRARERMNEMRERLELTEEQEAQLRPILAATGKKMREMRDKYMGQERSRENMTAMRDEAEKLQKQTRKKIEPILTDEQMKEFDKMNEEMREERRERMGRHGGGRGAR